MVLRKAKTAEYVVHIQVFPASGNTPYFEDGEYTKNYTRAVKCFTDRVLLKAAQQVSFENKQQ